MESYDYLEAEIDQQELPHRNILCVDMKAFYASIECVARKLDPLETYLAVVGDRDREGGVILAASPPLKEKYNIKTGNRLYEIPDNPEIKIVEARMGTYVETSVAITRLFNQFVPLEAIHVYSIDESWLKLDGTERLWGPKWEAARRIKKTLREKTGLYCSMGLGPNMFLAKVAMDIEGKKKGLVEWNYDDVPEKLWPVKLGECWGIGSRLEKRFNRRGIETVGELARLPRDYLEKHFGIMGSQLYYHARGIDLSRVEGQFEHQPKNLGKGITLFKDYTEEKEIKTVIFDLSEQVASRAREYSLAGKTVSLGISYSRNELQSGFFRQRTLPEYTNLTRKIYETSLELLSENYGGQAVRRVRVTLGNFVEDSSLCLNLFTDEKMKKVAVEEIKDELEKKFGPGALFYARSLLSGSVRERIMNTIGGHSP